MCNDSYYSLKLSLNIQNYNELLNYFKDMKLVRQNSVNWFKTIISFELLYRKLSLFPFLVFLNNY